jgi:hypothetical protein
MTEHQTQQNTLTELRVYSFDKGKTYRAEIKLNGYYHEIKLELNPDLAQKILFLCMDDVVKAIQDTSANALEAMRVAASNLIEEADTIDEMVEGSLPPALEDDDGIPF